MNTNELKDFSQRVSDQLFGQIMPFWCGPAVDHEQGGWMGWLFNDLIELIERHAHDSKYSGYLEVRRRDWSEADADARLSDKDMNEKKSMNNHLHLLEAYTNLYRVWKEPRVEQRLRELIAFFEQRILDPRTKHLNHFFDEEWHVRSNSYTFGHDIEGT
jgi:mannobiose 2-epimerase